MNISDSTKAACRRVAEICAEDMEASDVRCSRTMAYMALDANRLTTQGYPEADAEIDSLIALHGYQAVEIEIAKEMDFA